MPFSFGPRTFGKGWTVILTLLALLAAAPAFSQEVTVFDMRKTLPLNPNEPVFQDFYLNAGTEVGLKPGIIVTVKRRSTLYDAYQNRSPGDLLVPVGQLKVIHAQKGLSVARLHELISRDDLPVLEIDYIMVGDRLDLATARMDGGKGGKKRDPDQAQTAPTPAPAPVEAVAVTAALKVESASLASQAPQSPPAAPKPEAPPTPDNTPLAAPVLQ